MHDNTNYSGHMYNGKRHGFGISENGSELEHDIIYRGFWIKDLFHG